jgi:hypothetical protein
MAFVSPKCWKEEEIRLLLTSFTHSVILPGWQVSLQLLVKHVHDDSGLSLSSAEC